MNTPLACRKRPVRRPCPGLLVVRRQDFPPLIHWRCPACGESGQVTNWRRTWWDLTAGPSWLDEEEALDIRTVTLTEEEYRLLDREVIFGDTDTDWLIARARLADEGVVIEGPAVCFEDLSASIAFAANHADVPRKRGPLYRLFDRVEAAVAGRDIGS